MHLKKSNTYTMNRNITNPNSGRKISKEGRVYKALLRDGYVCESDTMIKFNPDVPCILDEEIPAAVAAAAMPLTPTKLKNKIVKKAGEIANWLLKIMKHRSKNNSEIVDWISDIIDKKESEDKYWIINIPQPENTSHISELIDAEIEKYGKENEGRKIKRHYYNSIGSLHDIHDALIKTYENEKEAFWLHFSFGSVAEKFTENEDGEREYNVKLYPASQNNFYDDPVSITNRQDMTKLISKLDKEHVVMRLNEKYTDTKTKLLGIYNMAVKVISRSGFLIGAGEVSLPDYIKGSPNIIGLENAKNNSCFWACLALALGCRRDRFIAKAKELYKGYHREEMPDDYEGFKLTELKKYEEFNTEFAINVVKYFSDKSIEYVILSKFNSERTPIYLNLYCNHFSYIPDLEKLAKMYVCQKCTAKFGKNYLLQRHINTCKLEQKDKFEKYPTVYEPKRNIIVQLSDWFHVEGLDFKHPYLITYDFEPILEKIPVIETETGSLHYVTKHVPICLSLATNVPGFEEVKFILNKDPYQLCCEMFNYLDAIALQSEHLMVIKMRPLLLKLENHYNKNEREKWLKDVYNYCTNIPVVGFNSSSYDINLVANYGFMKEIYARDEKPLIKKNGSRYKFIRTSRFTFLDQMSYCAGGTNLRKFIKAYNDGGDDKFFFPYEFLTGIEKLDCLISDLKIEDFQSSLKNTNITQMEFEMVMQTCKEKELICIKDFLRYYSKLDVAPMLEACLKMKEFYYDRKLDMYKDAVSLPGLSEIILFQMQQEGFEEYIKRKPPLEDQYIPADASSKISQYIEQDNKAGRDFDPSQYITEKHVNTICKQQNYACYYCWHPFAMYSWSLDRINCSLAHLSDNCVLACVDCNRQRKDTLMEKFYRRKALIRWSKTHPSIYLIDEENKDAFYKLKNNIVGGPSLVYHKYHEKDVTTIDRVYYDNESKQWNYDEGTGKLVKNIVGFDANALYLYCLGQPQLCGRLEYIAHAELPQTRKLSNKAITLQESMNNLLVNPISYLETFFGTIEVDIEIPQDKYNYFGENPPIFQTKEYSEELCGEFTKDVILKTGKGFKTLKD